MKNQISPFFRLILTATLFVHPFAISAVGPNHSPQSSPASFSFQQEALSASPVWVGHDRTSPRVESWRWMNRLGQWFRGGDAERHSTVSRVPLSRKIRLNFIAISLAVAVACGGAPTGPSTTPTPVTIPSVTLNGTIGPGGRTELPFTISSPSVATLTLQASVTLAMAVGGVNSITGNCNTGDFTTGTYQITDTSTAGAPFPHAAYCVAVIDALNQVPPTGVPFSIRIDFASRFVAELARKVQGLMARMMFTPPVSPHVLFRHA